MVKLQTKRAEYCTAGCNDPQNAR